MLRFHRIKLVFHLGQQIDYFPMHGLHPSWNRFSVHLINHCLTITTDQKRTRVVACLLREKEIVRIELVQKLDTKQQTTVLGMCRRHSKAGWQPTAPKRAQYHVFAFVG